MLCYRCGDTKKIIGMGMFEEKCPMCGDKPADTKPVNVGVVSITDGNTGVPKVGIAVVSSRPVSPDVPAETKGENKKKSKR